MCSCTRRKSKKKGKEKLFYMKRKFLAFKKETKEKN